jgi:hypothetical protein
MSAKVYFMINLDKGMDRQTCYNAMEELWMLPEVTSVEIVEGCSDIFVTVEAPQRVISVANKVRTKDWVKGFEMLKVIPYKELGAWLRSTVDRGEARKAA